MLDQEVRNKILTVQKAEVTEYIIYWKLSESIKASHNKSILKRIANDELAHHNFWKQYTGESARPNKWIVWLNIR